MPSSSTDSSADGELRALETRVEDLIRTCSTLKSDNRTLRSRHDELMAERARLIEKTEEARRRVEGMITRLRAMESSS
ncbi:MAG: TIGR02449 family protein [Chromatiales bacterium]|nr:TIGR02449 family protein [Chromatiales bacterium]